MYMLSVILGIIILILLCAWQTHRDAPMESSFKSIKDMAAELKQFEETDNQYKGGLLLLGILFILSLMLNFI